MPRQRRLECTLALFTVLGAACAGLHVGCSGSSGATVVAPEGDSGLPADAQSGTDAGDGGTSAATTTAQSSASCTGIDPFYWEIGDVNGAIVSGSVGGSTYTATTPMQIASASKFLFGAYVVERFKASLGTADFSAMTMRTGYVSLNYDSCVLTKTVGECLAAAHNGDLTASAVGLFDYNGGHFQHYASVDLGLADAGNGELAAEYQKYLATDPAIAFASPQLAAGVRTTPAAYASFLRQILAGQLAIHDHLGENAVCTVPPDAGPGCPEAIYSPAAPYAWHYSWGHWVEDDASRGDDGAFSSAGAFGFYPWVDASKRFYGVVARYSVALKAWEESAICGRAIRKAFFTGMPQP